MINEYIETDLYKIDTEILSLVKSTEKDQWDHFIFND